MDRRARAFEAFAGIVRDRDRSFVERTRAGLELVREALETESGRFARVADGEHTLLALATAADFDGDATVGTHRPLSETFCGLSVRRGELFAFGRIEAAPPEVAGRAAHVEDGLSSYVGAPVRVDDNVYGTCCFTGHEEREPFADWERALVRSLAAWVGDGQTTRGRERALAAERDRLDGFVAMVDHDVREPLSAARGAAQLASETAADGDADAAARHAADAVEALSRTDRLVDDLLRLSNDSERAAGVVPVDVRSVAEHAWGEVAGAGTDATLEATAGVRVPADQSLLKRLLAEGLRFCLTTGPDDLRVRVGPLDDRPGFFLADDGPGVPGDGPDRPADTGDGLEGIERIAAAHDWRVTVGLSAEGGVRIEVETDEGLWPVGRSTDDVGATLLDRNVADIIGADPDTGSGSAER